MSRTYLMGASDKDPEMGAWAQFGNAWGNQPMVWDALVKKYGVQFGANGSVFGDWDALFKWVYGGGKMEPWEINVFAMIDEGNFIDAVDGYEDMLLYAQSLRKFHEMHSVPDRICHLLKAAEVVEKLVEEKKTRWLAWYGTSINANPWRIRDKPEDEDTRPYNMVSDLGKPLYGTTAIAERVKMLSLDQTLASYDDVRQYRTAA